MASSQQRIDGRLLRYRITLMLHDVRRPMTIRDIVAALEETFVEVPGRPSKIVSDALRAEVSKGRVKRSGRGLYVAGAMPRSTRAWMRSVVRQPGPPHLRGSASQRQVATWAAGGGLVVAETPNNT